jgi:uncharacterized protein DUF664
MDDFGLLVRALEHQRSHVLATVEGLEESDLTRPFSPSGWTPAGMIQHMALGDERFWFREVFAGLSVARDDDPVNEWAVPLGGGRAAIERYREECALANEVIAVHSPGDEPAAWPDRWQSWRLSNLYQLTLHVVTETSCHAGHLDIAREFIDGTQYSVVE